MAGSLQKYFSAARSDRETAAGRQRDRRQTERPQADRETAGGQSEMGRMIDGR